MKLTPKFVSLYKKLKLKYPGKWYEGYQQNLLFNSIYLYDDFFSDFDIISKELNKLHSRRKRIRKYIRSMIEHCGYNIPCLVSLTFTDDVLSSTSQSTRKEYVRDYLNSFYPDWFACIDFGKTHGREHYHAICLFPYNIGFFTFQKYRKLFMLPCSPLYDWQYGFYSIRPLVVDACDVYKTLNYAFKSSSYAFKCSDEVIKPFHKRNGFSDIPDGMF